LSIGPRAVERIARREIPVQSWFMDANLVNSYWAGGARRSYHHTAPINALYGLHESLVILAEEGLEAAWARHRRYHLALTAGLEAMGLELALPDSERLPQLNVVRVPEGVDEAEVRRRLLEEYQLEVGAGLGELAGKVWRIGLMGHSCNLKNVLLAVGAFETVLASLGAAVLTGVAEAAAHQATL
ncbi:MAG: alanine--glyoxylate aminotransferase family protein, partial [Acidobacteriota bacterium]